MAKHLGSNGKAQVALDFMLSYGVAILVITLSLYVIFRAGLFSTKITNLECTPVASAFLCDAVSLSTSGNLTIILTQNTNGPIKIVGAACSSIENTTGNSPAYGNIGVLPYDASGASRYYPNAQMATEISVPSDNSTRLEVYCYTSSGLASSSLGNPFSGLVWLNYTYGGLPASLHNVQLIATFATKYT